MYLCCIVANGHVEHEEELGARVEVFRLKDRLQQSKGRQNEDGECEQYGGRPLERQLSKDGDRHT